MTISQPEQAEAVEIATAPAPVKNAAADTPSAAAEEALNAITAIFASADKVMSARDYDTLTDAVKNLHVAHMLAVSETIKQVDRSPAFTWSGNGGAKEVFRDKYDEAVGNFVF